MSQEEITAEINTLEGQLVGDMFQDMEIQEKIYTLKKELSTFETPTKEKPDDSPFECFGCGA